MKKMLALVMILSMLLSMTVSAAEIHPRLMQCPGCRDGSLFPESVDHLIITHENVNCELHGPHTIIEEGYRTVYRCNSCGFEMEEPDSFVCTGRFYYCGLIIKYL